MPDETIIAFSAFGIAKDSRRIAEGYQMNASTLTDQHDQLRRRQADLAEFEQRYGFTSVEFYRRYQAGQTDDRMDYVEWASLIQMADDLEVAG